MAAGYYEDGGDAGLRIDEDRGPNEFPDLCSCATDESFFERSDLDKLQEETQRVLDDEEVWESAQKPKGNRNLDDEIRLMAGSMLTYSTLMSANEGTETQAMKIVARRQQEKLRGCLMLPLAFVYFVLFCTSIMLHEDISDVYMIESQLRGQMDDIFGEVEDMDSLWDAIQGPFSEMLFKQTDMYGRALSKNTTNDKWGDWGRVLRYNQIQGALRFQQTRNVSSTYGKAFQCNSEISCFLCRSNRGFQPAYLNQQGSTGFVVDCGNWTSTRRLEEEGMEQALLPGRELSQLQPSMLTSLPDEKTDEMHVFRFYLYPSESASRTAERLQYFRDRVWMDKDSEVLQIRLYLLNAELGQPNMEQVTLTFFMSTGGSIYYQRDFQAVFFEVFPNMSSMVADGLFFCVLVFTGALQMVVLWRAARERKLVQHFMDIRSILEFAVIIVGIYFCFQFYAVFQTKERTTDIVNEIRAQGWDVSDDDQSVIERMFDICEVAAEDILSLRLLAANYTLILTFRFFANFRAQPQLAIITKTLGALIVVPPEVLLKMRDAIRSIERRDRRQAVSLAVSGCWFLVRELEIAGRLSCGVLALRDSSPWSDLTDMFFEFLVRSSSQGMAVKIMRRLAVAGASRKGDLENSEVDVQPYSSKATGPLAQAMCDAGLAENVQQYILSWDITSIEVLALDEILAEPLSSTFRVPNGPEIKLSKLEFPVVKAKLRFLWRKCNQDCNPEPKPSTTASLAAVSVATATPKSSSKELPGGYWQQQIAKFEAVKLGARRSQLVRRYFDASGNPNPLGAAKKKNKAQAAVLTRNADYQIETEAEAPWQPKSVLAFLDCLDSISFLVMLVEMGSEGGRPPGCDFQEFVSAEKFGRQLRGQWEGKGKGKGVLMHGGQGQRGPSEPTPVSGGPDPVAQLSSMHLVSAAEVDEVRSAELEKKRKQHDIREPLQRKIRKREPDDVVPVQSVDAILLSFFDGVGTAGLVFQQMCNERAVVSPDEDMELWGFDREAAYRQLPVTDHRPIQAASDSMLLQILLDDKLTPRQASAIAGKLQLFAQSMFGKASVAAVRPFHQQQQQQQGWQLSLGLKSAIAVLRFRLANAKPRILHFHVDYRSVIYADAFFNLGGLSYKLSEADSAPDWGKTSPASFVNGLGFVVSAVLHLWLWSSVCTVIVLFVDNEPAKHALVTGYGKDESINKLLLAAWVFTEKVNVHAASVAARANVSDSVSRGDFSLAESLGWQRFEFSWDELLRGLLEIIHFIVVFIPAFLIYVTSATLLFGRKIEDVSTFQGSLGYIFRMAQEGEFDWESMQEENYWSSAIWVWSFVVFVNMLLINLLIAIILDTYK
ncbi:pkd2, partial [Symbiodinium sp. KB8]